MKYSKQPLAQQVPQLHWDQPTPRAQDILFITFFKTDFNNMLKSRKKASEQASQSEKGLMKHRT